MVRWQEPSSEGLSSVMGQPLRDRYDVAQDLQSSMAHARFFEIDPFPDGRGYVRSWIR